MADSPPVYQFELNCLFTERDANLSQVQFKELNIESTFDPHFLRDALWDRDLIWYTERKSIYFLGNDRELRRILNEAELKTGATRLVPFEEMYSERQPILRFLLYSGLDRLMRAKGFLPTITRGDHVYYPYSVSTPDTPLTHAVTQSAARIIVKKGVIFDLDTSVEGQGLLWIDMKLVTFVHLGTPLSFGRPVYIMCEKRQDCTAGDHEILREGAFVSEEAPLDASALPCLSGKTGDSLLVRTKVRGKFIRVPNLKNDMPSPGRSSIF